MTNEQIIMNNRIELMQKGILKATDKKMSIEVEGKKKSINVPEEIHTYNEWLNLGRVVKKEQKSIATFDIWGHTRKMTNDIEKNSNGEQIDHFYLRKAHFFTIGQTHEIKKEN